MIRRPPRSTLDRSSAASDVYKRQLMDCNPPLTKCGPICVDTMNDPSHCGSCTTACASDDDGAAPTCSGGVCTFACNGGLTQCADGVCYDLQTSHDHCGTCATTCQLTETCAQG